MKVALVAESFLPHFNGVTNSLLRVIEHLTERGDEALVIAPEAKDGEGPTRIGAATITRVPSLGAPGYRDVRVALAGEGLLTRILADFEPDVVHLASPFVLGWTAIKAANSLGLPTVAVYQTEVPSYAQQYRVGWGEPFLWNRVRKIHDRATLTLVPSTHAMTQLGALGVERLRLWGRGVDARRFSPSKRSAALRRAWAPRGEVIVGYVGRLAPEKRVGDLARLNAIPGVSTVIVGEGPSEPRLRAAMPNAHFAGFLGGEDLARAMASFDLFVHCGELETFCQTIQEAHASGVPVVAPRRGGPVDLVVDGWNGHLYEPGNLDEMAAYVRALVDDPWLRASYGERARADVEGRTWSAVCDSLMDHYRDAIDASFAAAPRATVAVA
jgi:phosphatidylinositol alpha 1,6-mannosyltransferase